MDDHRSPLVERRGVHQFVAPGGSRVQNPPQSGLSHADARRRRPGCEAELESVQRRQVEMF